MKYNLTNVAENFNELIENYGEKLKMFKTEISNHSVKIEINSLEELRDFKGTIGHPLILFNDSIEIYDDYRE